MRAVAAGVIVAAIAALLLAPRPGRVLVPDPHAVSFVPGGTEVYGTRARELDVDGDNVYIHDLTIDGKRDEIEVLNPFSPRGLPAWNQPFTGFTGGNGILIDGRNHVTIRNVTIRNVRGFAILVARSHDVTIDQVKIENCGSRDERGHNNATGGILLEEGTIGFRVTRCELRNIRGNGIWTHSLYTSHRNGRGLIEGNRFDTIGRDAIQVGHATQVKVLDNIGWRIGYPAGIVDATPVAIDTAGNVDASLYAGNRFRQINGKCIDLDGFHDGEVRGNSCAAVNGFGIVMNNTNPDMQSRNIRIVENLIDGAAFGGVFVIGGPNLVARNRLLNLNMQHCNDEAPCYYAPGEPDMLRSGIYLGNGAERPAPARGNVIEDNEITGYKMAGRCIASAPAVSADWNTVRRNSCK